MIERPSWESLITGVPEIDIQHKELFRAFNEFADILERGQGASALKKLLVFLQYYAEWHFEREEQCAERYHCPIAEVNQKAHKRFLEIFGSLLEQCRESGYSEELARIAYKELAGWLFNHVAQIDRQIGECVHQSGNE
ncbi:MAG: hemerythrin family protein [Candidatus Methanomethylicaceae archaeon]